MAGILSVLRTEFKIFGHSEQSISETNKWDVAYPRPDIGLERPLG